MCDRVVIIARGRVVAAGHSRGAARPGGVEVETASRHRATSRTRPRGRAAARGRAWSPPASGSTGCGCPRRPSRTSTWTPSRRDGVRASGSSSGTRCASALRRRVFVVVADPDRRASWPSTGSARPGVRRGTARLRQASDRRRREDAGRRDAFRPLDVRDAVPGRRAGGVPDPRCRSAATPSAGSCSRWWCGRSAARRSSSRRFAGAAVVVRGLRRARLRRRDGDHRASGGWWPDRIVRPGRRARERRRASSPRSRCSGRCSSRPRPTASRSSWSSAPGWSSGLLGQIGDAIRRSDCRRSARDRLVGASLRGPLPGRAARADRRHQRRSPA